MLSDLFPLSRPIRNHH